MSFVHKQNLRIGSSHANRHDLPSENPDGDDSVEGRCASRLARTPCSCAHGLRRKSRRRAPLLVDAMFSHPLRCLNNVCPLDTWMPASSPDRRQVIELGHDFYVAPNRVDGRRRRFDEGGFAGTVLSDQAVNFAGIYRPVDSVEGDCAAETLADIFELEKRAIGRDRFCHMLCLVGESDADDESGNRAPAET